MQIKSYFHKGWEYFAKKISINQHHYWKASKSGH
jgi:hypothetical protein